MEVSELLWSALDIYRDHGGGTEQYYSVATGKVCLVGALYEATRILNNIEFDHELEEMTEASARCTEAEELVLHTIKDLFPEEVWESVEGFNDNSTKDQCEQVLHKTALRVSEVVT